MSRGWVYGLRDPRTSEIRYVGKTVWSLRGRYQKHLCGAQSGGQTYRDRWIREVLEAGHVPQLVVLEVAPVGGAAAAEMAWIATLRGVGCRLTNLTAGGEGMAGFKHSAETRAKISAAKLGVSIWSPEQRAQISVRRTGQRHSLETRAKIGAGGKGKVISAEQRAVLSARNKGKVHSAAHKQKISEGLLKHHERQRALESETP